MRHAAALLVFLAAAAPAPDEQPNSAAPAPVPAGPVTLNIIGPPIPPRPPGYEALSWPGRADRLLRDRDDLGLIATYERALQDNGGQTMLDWAGRHLTMDDRHALIADLIGSSYEQAAASVTDPVKRAEVLRRATIYRLLSIALTTVDGAPCIDQAAVQERLEQRTSAAQVLLAWARRQSPAMRADMSGRALAVESATFTKAPPDPTVCWAGHDIWQHADMAARHVIDTETVDGRSVTRIYVPTQRGWSPPLRADSLTARQTAQNGVKAALDDLLKSVP